MALGVASVCLCPMVIIPSVSKRKYLAYVLEDNARHSQSVCRHRTYKHDGYNSHCHTTTKANADVSDQLIFRIIAVLLFSAQFASYKIA